MPSSPLRPVVEKATAGKPEDRYQSVGDLLKAIELALGQDDSWESSEDTAKRLLERVRSAKPGQDTLAEMLAWAQALDEAEYEDMTLLTQVLPWLSSASIAALWDLDRGGFQRVYQRYSTYVQHAGFGWDYCDVMADFGRRVVEETDDHAMLRMTIWSLIALGKNHNRWHVRTVVVAILQGITTTETAIAAVEAVRDSDLDAIEWTITDFSVRTLQPALRAGIAESPEGGLMSLDQAQIAEFFARPIAVEGNHLLRDPQRDGYQAAVDFFDNGGNQAVEQIPVGCGKSALITLLPFGCAQGRVLVIAPNLQIRDQLVGSFTPGHSRCTYTKFAVLHDLSDGPYVAALDEQANRSDLDNSHVAVTNIHQLVDG